MAQPVSEGEQKPPRKPKAELDSRAFKDGAIYLFRRADYKKPTWFCRVKVPNVKGYISCSTKTTDEHQAFAFAQDVFNKALIQAFSGQDVSSRKTALAIKEFTDHIRKNESHRTTTKTRANFLEGLIPFFQNRRLKEINTSILMDLNDWIKDQSKNKRLSPNTIKRYTTDLKQFFNWCLERDYIEDLPRYPKIKGLNNRRPHFDNKDWGKLTRHLREYIKADYPWIVRDRTMLVNYVLILANTGIRVGEARGLKWSDLKEIPQPEGSNEPSNLALFVKGKTGAREVVARTSDVRDYFKRILELRTKELKGKKPSPNDYIFCNRNGTPIGSFKNSFSALLKSAGVEIDQDGNKRTIYSLRHTYATFRLQEGVHQFILAKNMGTSTAMLERHYGHTSSVASVDELTKGGRFKGGGKTTAIDWLME